MKSTTSFRFLLVSRVLLAGLILSGAAPPRLYAGEFQVNTTADTHDADYEANPEMPAFDGVCKDTAGNCSLRAAIEEISASPDVDEVGTIYLNDSNYKLTAGLLEIERSLSLYGVASGSTISGQNQSKVFRISKPIPDPDPSVIIKVFMDRIIIADGQADATTHGGGISNNPSCILSLTNSVVRNNKAHIFGMGISNSGVLYLDRCSVEGNETIGAIVGMAGLVNIGGGIYNVGTASIANSTISGNKSLRGGGIYNEGNLHIYNSTISGNFAYAGGGGIRNGSTGETKSKAIPRISFSTITNNTANSQVPAGTTKPGEDYRTGGGIQNFGTVEMDNTIVAGNEHCLECNANPTPGEKNNSPDCYSRPPAVFTSYRHNVVDVVNDNWNLQDFEAAGLPFDKVGVGKDPGLGEFTYHGGPNQPLLGGLVGLVIRTYSLEPGSPALDYAECRPSLPNKPPFTDQRGALRPGGFLGCDVGAFELGEPRDITASGLVGLKSSGSCYIREKNQCLETVTLKNTTGLPLNYPFFFLVLDNCTHTLLNRDGVSTNVGLKGSDYAIIHVRHSGDLFPEETILPTTLKFLNPPPGQDVPYTPRVLTDAGMP
jgi:CSLREA domain-containing protein